jgi:hypothetical protein
MWGVRDGEAPSVTERTVDGPTPAEVRVIAGAVVAATSLADGLTALQAFVLNAMCDSLLTKECDFVRCCLDIKLNEIGI